MVLLLREIAVWKRRSVSSWVKCLVPIGNILVVILATVHGHLRTTHAHHLALAYTISCLNFKFSIGTRALELVMREVVGGGGGLCLHHF